MHLVAISFKECWQDDQGNWISSGGFPLQMNAIASLFQNMTLLITKTQPKDGGIPFNKDIQIVPMQSPKGHDLGRKIYMVQNYDTSHRDGRCCAYPTAR